MRLFPIIRVILKPEKKCISTMVINIQLMKWLAWMRTKWQKISRDKAMKEKKNKGIRS